MRKPILLAGWFVASGLLIQVVPNGFGGAFTNGSFELPGGLAANTFVGLSSGDTRLVGWTIGGPSGVAYANGFILPELDFPAIDGTYQLAFNGGGAPAGTWIAQTFDTAAGQEYAVAFNVGRLGDGPGSVSLTASVRAETGQLLAGMTAVPPSHGYGLLQQFYFTATSSKTTLEFMDTSIGEIGSDDIALDAVSVTLHQSVTPPGQCCLPPPGLVAWWRGEGDAKDSARTNNGTLNGAAFAPGKVGWAFSFDGANDSVVVPDSDSLRLTTQFTIEAWINSRITNSDQSIVAKVGGAAGNNGYEFFIYRDNSLGGIFNSPGESWPSVQILYNNATAIRPGVWSHVAWTYDQSEMKLYLNGTLVATKTIGKKTVATTAANLRISGNDNNMNYFNGLIDEASVYNRALSASEIASIYSAGTAGKCQVPRIVVQPLSQVGYWNGNVTFTTTANGAEPLTYQWYKDGSQIKGANGASLLLTNLQTENGGSYTVVVTNPYGNVTSSPAMLIITPAAVDIALYAGLSIKGVIGNTYGIQYTTDLNDANSWRGVTNILLNTQSCVWYDSQPAIQPRRYYRVILGPISIP